VNPCLNSFGVSRLCKGQVQIMTSTSAQTADKRFVWCLNSEGSELDEWSSEIIFAIKNTDTISLTARAALPLPSTISDFPLLLCPYLFGYFCMSLQITPTPKST